MISTLPITYAMFLWSPTDARPCFSPASRLDVWKAFRDNHCYDKPAKLCRPLRWYSCMSAINLSAHLMLNFCFCSWCIGRVGQNGLPCSGRGVCNTKTNGVCKCDAGFVGDNCDDPLWCYGKDCSGHGKCVDKGCVCDQGWEGSSCQIPTSLVTQKTAFDFLFFFRSFTAGA